MRRNRERTAPALSDSALESRGALGSRFPAAQHAPSATVSTSTAEHEVRPQGPLALVLVYL